MLKTLVALVLSLPWQAANGHRLTTRVVSPPGVAPSRLIVGRAACSGGGGTWLLTEQPALVEISLANRTAMARTVRGLKPDDRPLGLACLADGTLWTLASPRTVARLGQDGRVLERVDFTWPRVSLFAIGDRLLFQQLPTVVAAPILAATPPRRPLDVQSWPGLLGRATASPTDQLSQNLVNCGIGTATSLPCWFANDAGITVSDGKTARRQTFPALQSSTVDRTLPIRDVAITANGRIWVLATAPESVTARRAGGRLIQTDREGSRLGEIDLDPPARVLLSATDARCVLLSVRGELVEVTGR